MKIVASLVLVAGALSAQQPQSQPDAKKEPKVYTLPAVFRDSSVLEITLTAPFRKLKKQRNGAVPYSAAEITYAGDSGIVRVPVKVRPRGVWRRQHCDIPPLRLNFSKDSVKKTEFRHLDNVRLVMHCRDNDDFEQYVLQEQQLYRVQRLLTPLTMNTRLVRVTYVDTEKKDTLGHRYGFLLESEPAFAERMGGKVLDIKGAGPEDLDPAESALFGIWQYFIGNTDFSVTALHNVALFQRDTSYFPIAYDYDWSGVVHTRYSTPAPQLGIRSVTERIMRGYCTDAAQYDKALALFRDKKDAIYALYRDSIGAMMKPDVVNNTLKYYDDFYNVIKDQRLTKRLITGACLGGRA